MEVSCRGERPGPSPKDCEFYDFRLERQDEYDEDLAVVNITTLGLLTFEEKDDGYNDHTLIQRAKRIQDAYHHQNEDIRHVQMFDFEKSWEEFTKAQGDRKKQEEIKTKEHAEKRATKKRENEARKIGTLSSLDTPSRKRPKNDVIELDSDMSTDNSLQGPASKFIASSGKKKREGKKVAGDGRVDEDHGEIFLFTFTSINERMNLRPQLQHRGVSKEIEVRGEGEFN